MNLVADQCSRYIHGWVRLSPFDDRCRLPQVLPGTLQYILRILVGLVISVLFVEDSSVVSN